MNIHVWDLFRTYLQIFPTKNWIHEFQIWSAPSNIQFEIKMSMDVKIDIYVLLEERSYTVQNIYNITKQWNERKKIANNYFLKYK